jgi:Cys-rich four helix bundle protein (predicted Tat secretion target)
MNRRELIRSATLATASSIAAVGFAQQDETKSSMQHQHNWDPKYAGLATAAADCATKADACTEHCQAALSAGDNTYVNCLKPSAEVATACDALRKLAAQNATITPKMASVALQACKTCEAECRKHEKDAVCKACADSCAACAKECEKAAHTA